MSVSIGYSLEDAIIHAGFGKFNYIIIVLSGWILACSMLETNSISMVLPIAQCELNLSDSHKGLLGSVGYIGIILSSHFWGFMADTRGRKKVLMPALLLAFLSTVISSFGKNFWFIAFFRFVNGFCICATQTITYAFLGEYHSSKRRANVLIVASVVYGIIGLINPLNGIVFLNRDTWNVYIPIIDLNYRAWRIFLVMNGLPSVIGALGLLLLIPESPKFVYAQGNEKGTLEILQTMFKMNTGKSVQEYQVSCLLKDKEFEDGLVAKKCGFFKFVWSQTVPLFKSPHLRNVATACFLQFAACLACNGFFTFFPETLNKVSLWLEGDSSETSATVCQIMESFYSNVTSSSNSLASECVTKLELSTYWNVTFLSLLYSLFWFIISIVVVRTGRLFVLVTVFFTCAAASFAIMCVKIPMLSIYLYLVLLMAALNMSVINTSTVELVPTTLRGMAVSISMMTGRIGSVAGSNFVGIFIQNFCTYTWLLPAVLLTLAGLLSFTIPNVNKRG